MKKPTLIAIVVLILVSQLAISPVSGGESKKIDITFNPVVMDAKDGTGAIVGIEYKFGGKLLSKDLSPEDTSLSLAVSSNIGSAVIGYSGGGTIAVSRERNPRDFLEFLLDAKLRFSALGIGTIAGGLFSKLETDQGFSDKQVVYGIGATFGKYAALAANDFIALDASYGRVDPQDDAERKAVLGSETLISYYRWNLEFLYMYPLRWNSVRSVEFNYRFFLEHSAPSAIMRSGMDKYALATFRIGLKNDLFIAYSTGKLPFNRGNDQILQIGFSYKLI